MGRGEGGRERWAGERGGEEGREREREEERKRWGEGERERKESERKVSHTTPLSPSDRMACDGLSDIQNDQAFNVVSFLWSPLRENTLAFKVNCLSTEFAARKHGGSVGDKTYHKPLL